MFQTGDQVRTLADGMTGTVSQVDGSILRVTFDDGSVDYFSAPKLQLADVTIGATRDCPDCGRPQHYTGAEYGWAHDALVDTWHCAGDRVRANKVLEPGEFCGCPGDTHLPDCPASASTERARQIISDPFAAAFDGVEEAEF